MSREVVVVPTGAANLASVMAALARLGAAASAAGGAEAIRAAGALVVPGVGSFGAVQARLGPGPLGALRERVAAGRPTLGICLGMQLLAEGSDEAPEAPGAGAVAGRCRRLPAGVRVPHMGWNAVVPEPGTGVLTSGHAYFANSYALPAAPRGWRAAWFEHGGRWVAALERGRVLLCQFHPELSGRWGRELLARWLDGSAAAPGDPPPVARLLPRVIPCLDVDRGRVVKGVRFQGLRDAGDPVELAAAYASQGADELVLLDVSATPEGRGHAVEVVRRVRAALDIPLTAGGGVRCTDDARRLLEAGADKVAVNSAAVAHPALLEELALRFGRQCTVLALDAARRDGGWEVVVRSGRDRTGRDAVAWAREAVRRGAGEVLLTSWDRDGTRRGYDLELVRAVSRSVPVPVIASGGADSPAHMAQALAAGADAVLAASIFHDRATTVAALKAELRTLGVEVRP